MKIFTAGLLTETCDLTPIPTTLTEWKVERSFSQCPSGTFFSELLTLFKDMAAEEGWETCESICASAFPPGGRTVKSVYESLRETILTDLREAMPVDGVLLQLHGAAMAFGYDDCEGDLLEHIRNITGHDIPIGIELDPHCHITEKMMRHTTLMVLYKTWLHTDMKERALELFRLFAKTLRGEIKPAMALFDCKMIDFFDESTEPMKSFLDKVCLREKEDDILSISPVHGFPLANVSAMGSKMLVITDNNVALANQVAEELGKEFCHATGKIPAVNDTEASLALAQRRSAEGEKSIPLLDFGDLAGCGFPTDSTEIIQAMLSRGMTNLAAGLMWDPMAVSLCHTVGAGTELRMRIGGKASPLSGTPLDLLVCVERIYNDYVTKTWIGEVELGDVAVVSCGKTELILVSKRVIGYGLPVFEELGILAGEKDYLLFKFTRDQDRLISIYGSSFDYRNWPCSKISRPKWPWDKKAFADHNQNY